MERTGPRTGEGKVTKLTVLIPAYNEEAVLDQNVRAIKSYLDDGGYDYTILIVNDGSSDRTAEIARQLVEEHQPAIQLISDDVNRGKGYAVKAGMLVAEGSHILFMDADLSTPIEELAKFIPALDDGCEIVIGTRKTTGAEVVVHQPFFREFLGKIFTFLTNSILRTKVSDATCGFKCFSSEPAKKIFDKQRLYDWSFDAEVIFLCRRYGYEIRETPVRWINNEDSKVNPVRDGLRSLLGLFKIRLNGLLGRY